VTDDGDGIVTRDGDDAPKSVTRDATGAARAKKYRTRRRGACAASWCGSTTPRSRSAAQRAKGPPTLVKGWPAAALLPRQRSKLARGTKDEEHTMSLMGHERRLTHPAETSAIALNADIRLRCNK
jgi:hypothetical protein